MHLEPLTVNDENIFYAQILSKRLDDAVEVAASLRADIQEDRKKIREIDEGVREAKKRKREEELAAAQV